MPLTFIHTADWHLGHTYWRIGPRAAQSSTWRLDAVRRIWALAAEKNADFILVAGDVFDSDTPSAAWRRHAVELLADAPAPVYLISGNHDPCAQGSVWFQPDFAGALEGLSNVHLVTEAAQMETEGDALLFPCPVTKKYTRDDATAWIPAASRGEKWRLGLAHGHWKGYFSSGEDLIHDVIANDCADRAGLDYLALGDYHSYTPPDHAAAKARTFYAGTPEIGAKDNIRGGHALCVTIENPGATPVVEPCGVGRVKLHDFGAISLHGSDDFEKLKERAKEIGAPEDSILRARVSGHVAPSLVTALDDWLGGLREEWLGVDVDVSKLFAQPTLADFQALRLERLEEALLESLGGTMTAADLVGVRGASEIATWSDDENARREALALYYRLLVDGR